jgi:hypothetical protein
MGRPQRSRALRPQLDNPYFQGILVWPFRRKRVEGNKSLHMIPPLTQQAQVIVARSEHDLAIDNTVQVDDD